MEPDFAPHAFISEMPRFYLHISDGHEFIEDEEGMELKDAEAAREEAIRGARDVMAEDIRSGELNLSSFIEVEDEEGRWLLTISFGEVVELTQRHPTPSDGRRGDRTRH